ncbi:MAG: endonuclease NucS [Candidatus Micrarchaeota archaeon]|nr:endonuclease NucS [Candidatus Micrarchaeota archaeon]
MVSFTDAKRVVDSALASGRLAILVGRCRVLYEGRAASKLSEGDRVLIVKSDGTFLVHQSKGMSAINYQGPGAAVATDAGEKELVVVARRKKAGGPAEKIEVHFESVAFADSFPMKDDASLRLFGSERQLSDLLMGDLHLIEPGLVPLKKESEVRKGTIDILAEDKKGNLVVIEVKRRTAELAAASQLKRYVDELSERKGRVVRGILVAPGVSASAHKMLDKAGLEFFKMDYEIGNPSARIKGLQKKQKELGEFA